MKLGLGATAAPCCCLAVGTLTLEIASPSSFHLPIPLHFFPLGVHQLIGSQLARVSEKYSLQTLSPASQSRTSESCVGTDRQEVNKHHNRIRGNG